METSDAHKLVKNGVYRVLRHPVYLGLMCLFIGIPVCEGSWGGMVISIMGGIPAILNRIRIEDCMPLHPPHEINSQIVTGIGLVERFIAERKIRDDVF